MKSIIAWNELKDMRPWKADGEAVPKELPVLTNGRWKQGDRNGALLEADGLSVDATKTFFQEAIAALSA